MARPNYVKPPSDRIMGTLASKLLNVAGGEFGNHGCNDMNLNEFGLSPAEQVELVTFMESRNGSPEETPHAIARLPFTSDFVAMFACAEWAKLVAARTSSISQDPKEG